MKHILLMSFIFCIAKQCLSQALIQSVNRITIAQSSISYNQPIAINIKGGGYLKYSYRDYGISLRWDKFPVYEWVIQNGNKTGAVDFSEPFQLYNTKVKRYMVNAHQKYGINLNWSSAAITSNNASREWIFEGNTTTKNPSGRMTNKSGHDDHYISYGSRTWGINMVWTGKPTVQNIQLITDEITPSELVSDGGSWSFKNFNTGTLSWDSFVDAFDLDYKNEDYYNPMTWIIFEVARYTLAKDGNCFGMCLAQELVAERNTTAFPYFGRIQEPIWPLSQNSSLSKAINYFHWKQISTQFLRPWLHGLNDSYSSITSKIKSDLLNQRFGLLSIYKSFPSFSGHVVIPYKVTRNASMGEDTLYLYDPNHPITDLKRPDINKMVIKGGDIMYRGDKYEEMAYVPYQRTSSYENIMNSLFDIGYVILGDGTEMEQVTDENGNTLFSKFGDKKRMSSSNPVSRGITPFAILGDDYGQTSLVKDTSIKDKMQIEFLEKKMQQFGTGAKCYLIHNINLKNLKFSIVSKGNKPVVIEVGSKDESVLISAVKKNEREVFSSASFAELKKPGSSLYIKMDENDMTDIEIEKTARNKSNKSIDFIQVVVPAKGNSIKANFDNNDNVTIKTKNQIQELNAIKTQLLRTGEKTQTSFKARIE